MAEAVETLLTNALTALQSGDETGCETHANAALSAMTAGDHRMAMALSLRGAARLRHDAVAGIEDMRESVRLAPQNWQVQLALGEAFLSLDFATDAEQPLSEAVKLSGGHPDVVASYCQCLLKINKPTLAFQILSRIIQARKATPAVMKAFAQALYNRGDIYASRDVLNQLYGADGPKSEEDRLQLARIDMSLREFEPASAQLDALLGANPDSLKARILAVTLSDWTDDQVALQQHVEKLMEIGRDHADAMAQVIEHGKDLPDEVISEAEGLLTRPGDNGDGRMTLGYALAKYFDQKGDYERAWSHASNTNALFAEHFGIVQTEERRTEQLRVTRRRLEVALKLYAASAELADADASDRQKYIYLVGSPRSGSSLLQSILAAPEGVASIGERTSLYPYLADATERDMPEAQFISLARQLAKAEAAGLQRKGVAEALLVEKTPHHLYVAGLLDRVNPQSRFIQVFRDAGEVGLSMLFRPFSVFFPETSSLDALADMLEVRLEVGTAWKSAGLDILPFSFDAFRTDAAGQAEPLFRHLGLGWSVDHLDPKSRPEAVTTFSARQVRKPIYAEKAPRWKSYESFAPEAFARLAEITEAQNAIVRQG